MSREAKKNITRTFYCGAGTWRHSSLSQAFGYLESSASEKRRVEKMAALQLTELLGQASDTHETQKLIQEAVI